MSLAALAEGFLFFFLFNIFQDLYGSCFFSSYKFVLQARKLRLHMTLVNNY